MDQPQEMADAVGAREVSEEDALRARFYGMLARLLAVPPSEETLSFVRALEGDETEMGRAVASLASVAAKTSVEAAEDEFTLLFYGQGAGGEVLPYASFYRTGFLLEKPLVELRGDMERFGIAHSGTTAEPEDHIAILCEMMHGLILGRFGKQASITEQKEFFAAHIGPWASRCFEDIERAKSAVLYMPVGAIGRMFVGIEAQAFEMTA